MAALGGLPLTSRAMAAEPLTLELYPNPAVSGPVTLSYTLTRPEVVQVTVFDALGRAVATVADGQQLAGAHSLVLQAGALAAGVYVVRAQVGERASFRRLVVE